MPHFNDEDGFEQLGFEDFEQLDPAEQAPVKKPGPSLKARAIDFLSRREHSRLELQRKLQRHSADTQAIDQLLDDLEAQNWLSDERFAHSFLNRRAHKFGTRRLIQELRQQGIDTQHLDAVRDQLQDTELERAYEVWSRKFGFEPTDPKSYAKQYRFMASRGFSPDLLRKILDRFKQST